MNCRKFRQHILRLLDGKLDPSVRAETEAHAKSCPACAQWQSEMEQTFSALRPLNVKASPEFTEKVMKKIYTMQAQENTQSARRGGFVKLWKPVLAVAAIAIVAALLSLFGILNRPVHFTPAAYALEQTIEANRAVRSIHLQCEPSGQGIGEMWAQFDEGGNLLHLRMNFPNTSDGPKDVVWQEGKAEIWFKAKNSDLILGEPNILKMLKMSADQLDPRKIVELLNRQQAEGKVQIETKEPAAAGEPITLTVTPKDAQDEKEVYLVDPNTKLVTQLEKNGAAIKFLDYNQPIDPAIFTLNPPADVMRIDQTAQEIGLAKGNLTDREIVIKVAREFFEALIAGNYAKAGQLYEGIPGAAFQKSMEEKRLKFIRVISIGEPTPSPKNGGGAMHVPCEVEVEVGGVRSTQQFNPGIRQVYNQRDRWTIFGGFDI